MYPQRRDDGSASEETQVGLISEHAGFRRPEQSEGFGERSGPRDVSQKEIRSEERKLSRVRRRRPGRCGVSPLE